MKLVQLALLLLSLTLAQPAHDCFNNRTTKRFAHHCCPFPTLIYENTPAFECIDACRGTSGCCMRECAARKLRLFENGKFNADFAAMSFQSTSGNGEWRGVVKRSVEQCVELVPATNSSSEPCKHVPDYVHVIMACILKYNFLDCPDMVASGECEAVREFVREPTGTECLMNFEDEKILHFGFYYGFVYDF